MSEPAHFPTVDLPARRARLRLASPEATERLANDIAPVLTAEDCLLLRGDLGTGKTHFARSLIQTRLAAVSRHEEVPSPSFTLVQTYDAGDLEIWHADLYRLGGVDEVWELGLDAALGTALCLVEWPERALDFWPKSALWLSLEYCPDHDDARILTLYHHPDARAGAKIAEIMKKHA